MDPELKIESDYSPSGYQPNIEEWISKQDYVPHNLIAIVMRNFEGERHAQRDEVEMMAMSVKNVIETHPLSVVGFRSGLEVDIESGEVTTLGSAPVFYFRCGEIYGRPIEALMRKWITDDVAPLYKDREALGEDFEAELRKVSIDVMFIEPDPTHTVVVRAWSCENFHPTGVRGEAGERDFMRAGVRGRVVVRFKAAIKQDEAVFAQAHSLLNGVILASANPHEAKAFVNVVAADLAKKNDQ